MNEKTPINSIYSNLWAPTAGILHVQGSTVMQQCVYQMKFRNVCEVKKRLVQPRLVWSRTLWSECSAIGIFHFQFYYLRQSQCSEHWRRYCFYSFCSSFLPSFCIHDDSSPSPHVIHKQTSRLTRRPDVCLRLISCSCRCSSSSSSSSSSHNV